MAHDQIEFGEPEFRSCDCCGKTLTSLTRFVYRDDDAFAVYYLDLDHDGDRPIARGLVGFGEWGDDDVDPEKARVAFAFQLTSGPDAYAVTLIDADETRWTTAFLGRRLTRLEALGHPLRQEVFDLTDHITRCDKPAIAHFN